MPTAPSLPAGFPAMSIERAHKLLVSAPASPFEVEERAIRGVKIKTWKNAPPSLAAVFEVSTAFGPRVYMVNDDERVTFAAHRRAVSVLAQRLVADGVKKGDRVAIIMRNLPEWSVAFWGGDPANFYATHEGKESRLTYFDLGQATLLVIAAAMSWNGVTNLMARHRILATACVLILLVTVVLSFRRTAWLGLMLALGWMIIVQGGRRRFQLLAVMVLASVLFIVPTYQSVPLRRAMVTYFPTSAFGTWVSSHTVGTSCKNSNPGWPS